MQPKALSFLRALWGGLALSALLSLASCGKHAAPVRLPEDALVLRSPGGDMELRFALVDSVPFYSLRRHGQDVLLPSRMGFTLKGQRGLEDGFALAGSSRDSLDETWRPVWGEEEAIRNHFNELCVMLRQSDGGAMDIRFRLYDEGLGFRYEFPMENRLTYFQVTDERTEFALTGDHTAWWIPGDFDTQEFHYTRSRLSEIRGKVQGARSHGGWPWVEAAPACVQTALQMKTDSGLYLNLHEAAVLDYPTMHLDYDARRKVFRTLLTPDAEGLRARLQAPCKTPWRTVMACGKATEVLASRLILNLNEPCALEDVSWIHPVKYMGVWWEMIAGKSKWSYTDDYPSVQLGVTDYAHSKPHGRHGANNANVRRYTDFAAQNGFDAVLVEGWNEGWEDWFGHQKDFVFDFVTPYPDFDLPALNAYAHKKGIRLIMHHETSSSTVNYERWMPQAYQLMDRYGYNAVKSGYVGWIIPYGEHHYSQALINHYHYAVTEAARHHIMVNAHEAVRPTGLCRTWPNMIGNESAVGTEFKGSIRPGHTSILPFTRLQGGPMDYTPGIFETDISKVDFHPNTDRMHHTLANQLGLYVTFYSPLQMAADLPEHYAQFMDAFQFIKDVAVDWDKSLYLEAEPGEYIVTARHPKTSTLNAAAESTAKLRDAGPAQVSGAAKFVYALPGDATAKDLARAGKPRDVWYVGGVCGETPHEARLALDFLTPGMRYEATLYADAADADCDTAPQRHAISRSILTQGDSLSVRMVRGGGFALSLRELR